jgi:hypothetical protein
MIRSLIFLFALPLLAESSYTFRVSKPSEVVADLELSGGDWSVEGQEAALADVSIDGAPSQNVMTYAGTRHAYPIFLGVLAAGEHKLEVKQNTQYGAAGAKLEVHGAKFREIARDSSYYPVLAYTPVLFARANTVGKFTDVPMIIYVERLVENNEPLLSYTVIFSNEDGGTSTRALMARWGRTTDVEYVYKAFLNLDGSLKRATMQGRGHQEVEFNGQREGAHPLMIPVTDNNMVSGEATSAIRYQIAPVEIDLTHHSRELIIDENPLAYRVMSQELRREGKLRPFGTVDGNKVSDPRNYLYIEAKIAEEHAGVAAMVRLKGEDHWRTSNLGREDYAMDRSGWVRTTVELPPGTPASEVDEIGFFCVVVRTRVGPPAAGTCRVDELSKAFKLDSGYVPQKSIAHHEGVAEIPSGQMVSWKLGAR